MRLCTLLLALLTLAICFAPTQAALVERDFLVPGDGLLVYDTVNRREWLKFPVAGGLDLRNLSAAMAPGEIMDSFVLASVADVESLAKTLNVNRAIDWTSFDNASFQGAALALDLLNRFNPRDVERVRKLMPPLQISHPLATDRPFTLPVAGDVLHIRNPLLERDLETSYLSVPYLKRHLAKDGIVILHGLVFDESDAFSPGSSLPLDSIYFGISDPELGMPTTQLSSESSKDQRGGFAKVGDSPYRFDLVGPYWLTRTAVPEPSTLVLLLPVSFIILAHRKRA